MASALLTGSTMLLIVQYDKNSHFFDTMKDILKKALHSTKCWGNWIFFRQVSAILQAACLKANNLLIMLKNRLHVSHP